MNIVFNTSMWQQVWEETPTTKNRLQCPLLLKSPVIALLISSPTVRLNDWSLGAYVQREVFTGLVVGGLPDARLDGSKKLYLNKLQVFTYSVKCEYSLVASCFVYGSGVRLFAWEYTGVIN
ncbi:hypothetical protein [Chroococcidiopsis sp.]|uniref:hypothetical protein n=1 Tax=Chroococcidiopsis sp. TaxID=3088168 RepID=UPI003F3FC929